MPGQETYPDVSYEELEKQADAKRFEAQQADLERIKKLDDMAQRSRELAEQISKAEPPEHILQFFEYDHLPAHLQVVSVPFHNLAHGLVVNLPRNPERTVALRKLLEGKDAAVRAAIAKG